MSLPHQDGIGWDTLAANGPPRFFLPIPVDFSTRAVEQEYLVRSDVGVVTVNPNGTIVGTTGGAPLGGAGILPLSTPHPTLRGFYLVEEKNWESLRANVFKLTRVYSMIPRTREEWQSYSYQVPGIGSTSAAYPYVTISTMVNTTGVTTITTSAAHGLSTGDFVEVQFNVVDALGNQYTRFQLKTATVTSSTIFTVPIIVGISPPVAGTMQCRKVEPGRDPETQVVNCRVVFDYFLPGVSAKISTPSDIPNTDPLYIQDQTGRKTNTVTGNTSPTATQYKALISAGTQIQIERSSQSIWRGNIYQRITRFITAI